MSRNKDLRCSTLRDLIVVEFTVCVLARVRPVAIDMATFSARCSRVRAHVLVDASLAQQLQHSVAMVGLSGFAE